MMRRALLKIAAVHASAGILVWSMALICEGHNLSGAALFAVLVNMKHLFACLGPLYTVYLLRAYCRYACGGQRTLRQNGKHVRVAPHAWRGMHAVSYTVAKAGLFSLLHPEAHVVRMLTIEHTHSGIANTKWQQ